MYGGVPQLGVPGVPQWLDGFILWENPMKMDDLGYTPMHGNLHLGVS